MLDDAAIERFSRQIVVPGIGAEGQQRISDGRLEIIGDPVGVEHARAYALAAGFARSTPPNVAPTCVLVAGTASLDRDEIEQLHSIAVPILWYRIENDTIIAGTVSAKASLSEMLGGSAYAPAPATDSLHALAAADLVAAAIASVLGWSDVEAAYRVTLG